MTRIAVIDLETTGQSAARGDKIIEIGIVIIEKMKIVDTYSQYVNPGKLIPPFITQLTSITNEDVMNQSSFSEVAPKMMEMLEDSVIVAHNVLFDIPFLQAELQHAGYELASHSTIDTVELARVLLPQAPGYKLTELSKYLNLNHEQPHRAISDAIVTAQLFLHLLEKLNRLPETTVQQLQELFTGLKTDFAQLRKYVVHQQQRNDLFYNNGFYLKKEGETNELDRLPTLSHSFQDYLDSFYQQGGQLSKIYPDYEQRDSQARISEVIFSQFEAKRHALIEADTGIGKTVAYLIPVIYAITKRQERVVISTSTTNLQTQLLHDELMRLIPSLSHPLKVTIVKGKSHFLSLAKFYTYFHDKDANNEFDRILKGKILVWLTETKTGDIDDISLHRQDNPVFQNLLVSSEKNSSKRFKGICFYERMKKQASQAQLIITNHAVLSMDLWKKEDLLPPYQKLIIDEAHHIETSITKHMGESISYVQFAILYNQLEKKLSSTWSNQSQQLFEELKYETDVLFRLLFSYVKGNNQSKHQTNDIGKLQLLWEETSPSFKDSIKEIIDRLRGMYKSIEYNEKDNDIRSEITSIDHYIGLLRRILLDLDEQQVVWIEIDRNGAENAVYLYKEALHAAKLYIQELFDQIESVIMLSGAFTINQNFDYMKKKWELESHSIDYYRFSYEFPYDNHIQLMIPDDLPAIQYPSNDDFIIAVTEAIFSLATAKVHQKILVLFTSYDMLKRSYYLLKETDLSSDYVLIGQGITSGSRNRLIKQFQSYEQAILFGTNAFWEGIDLPGDDLTCLMIVKLPFQSPSHPIYKKKAQATKSNGKNPFMEISLPEAVLQFRQGFGRLIRKKTDHGVIFVMDDRLMTKSYGQYFLDSIPKVPIRYDALNKLIDEANNWL